MNRPDELSRCPAHGDLVGDLALGALADGEARRAEQALAECPRCRDWWQGALAVEAVETGVADGLAAFRPPALPAAGQPWARIAAAAVLLVAGAAWLGTGGLGPRAGDDAAAGSEEPELRLPATVAPLPEPRPDQIILADDLESGTLGAWSEHSS